MFQPTSNRHPTGLALLQAPGLALLQAPGLALLQAPGLAILQDCLCICPSKTCIPNYFHSH